MIPKASIPPFWPGPPLPRTRMRCPSLTPAGMRAWMVRDEVQGAIVNIGSVAALAGQPFIAPYCASKAALATFTRNTAFAAMRNKIRVNQLNIGWMASEGEDRIQREFHQADAIGWT